MSKLLKLQPKPTFKLSVDVPVVGENETVNVVFTVKTLKASEIHEYEVRLRKIRDGELEAEFIPFEQFASNVVQGWDLDEPFSKESLLILLDNNPLLGTVLWRSYLNELFSVAEKN